MDERSQLWINPGIKQFILKFVGRNWSARLPLTLVAMWLFLGITGNLAATSDNAQTAYEYFEYQSAAKYSNLEWYATTRPRIKVKINPIQNLSGVPVENRVETADYYNHGKIPAIIDTMLQDLFYASYQFLPVNEQADYIIDISLTEYHLPFKYAPDDVWWQKLHDDTDRWAQKPPPARVKLNMTIGSGYKPLKPWLRSSEMLISYCDVNSHPQTTGSALNQDPVVNAYRESLPGQAFIAASNHLILQASERLAQEPQMGRVIEKAGNEFSLYSEQGNFVKGSEVALYYHRADALAPLPAGKLRIIDANNNYARAYPVNLRPDHIRVNDKVTLNQRTTFTPPKSRFVLANDCPQVSSAEALDVAPDSEEEGETKKAEPADEVIETAQ